MKLALVCRERVISHCRSVLHFDGRISKVRPVQLRISGQFAMMSMDQGQRRPVTNCAM
jgi:hypothetical protein